MKRLVILMLIGIIAFFLWIRYQLSIPGSGDIEDWNAPAIKEGNQVS